MNDKKGQGAKKLTTQKRTFGYACDEISGEKTLSPEGNLKIYNEIPFNFKRLYIKDGEKFIDGFYKGNDIEELMNNDYYLIHTSKIKECKYIFNDILFTKIYNVNYETKDMTFKVIPLSDDGKKEMYYSYFKKVYKDKEIESPYKEFELDETVEKEFLFKYLYESLNFETSKKLQTLRDIILDMQFGKVKSYKEIIFSALDMEKMIQDFFGFIKEQRNKKSTDIVRDIYIHHVYEYQYYYPYYNYQYPYTVWNLSNQNASGYIDLTTTSSADLSGSPFSYTTGAATSVSSLDTTVSTDYFANTATTNSFSGLTVSNNYDINSITLSNDETTVDDKIDDLYTKLLKINENNL
jgi:hypothetical protein